ncbi:MAG: hypothetical protein R3D57_07480 [Hyphomicrobiaceae bacterium]
MGFRAGTLVLLSIAILLVVGITAAVLISPSVAGAAVWRATITPLASIIGSGFLVLGPILDKSYGSYAPLAMAGLCLCAYLFGAAIRFNIAVIDGATPGRGRIETALETLASWSLAFAYVISVAYYLNLFGAFAVSLTAHEGTTYAKLVTTAVYVLILAVGWTRGFKMLERLEYGSVTTKLAIISGLLLGLALFFGATAIDGHLITLPAGQTGWSSITLAFGLLITVQGFETSRYLGRHYDANLRIRSMRLAQAVTTAIYMVYITLLVFSIDISGQKLSETAIIAMMHDVAPILPALLIVAALSAQFSAAIADTGGAGGLVAELTQNTITARQGYAFLVASGLVMTWSSDVFQIINSASRAFALYYALQALIAAAAAYRMSGRRLSSYLFLLLAMLGLAIAIFGQPVGA